MLRKLIPNKKADTILEAMNSTWNYTVGFPSIGYFADNGREFANVKMDELVSKLGLTIQFGYHTLLGVMVSMRGTMLRLT